MILYWFLLLSNLICKSRYYNWHLFSRQTEAFRAIAPSSVLFHYHHHHCHSPSWLLLWPILVNYIAVTWNGTGGEIKAVDRWTEVTSMIMTSNRMVTYDDGKHDDDEHDDWWWQAMGWWYDEYKQLDDNMMRTRNWMITWWWQACLWQAMGRLHHDDKQWDDNMMIASMLMRGLLMTNRSIRCERGPRKTNNRI